jgi:hypothetical protein
LSRQPTNCSRPHQKPEKPKRLPSKHPLLGTEDVLAFMRDSDPLNWPEIETVVVGQLRGANPNIQGAIASNISRNKAHRSRRQTVADEVARGDD